jgi:hypothetical protein
MLNRSEEARSARAFVPYLSQGTFVRVEIWLRGRATSGTCSCGAGRRRSVGKCSRGKRYSTAGRAPIWTLEC